MDRERWGKEKQRGRASDAERDTQQRKKIRDKAPRVGGEKHMRHNLHVGRGWSRRNGRGQNSKG